MNSMLDYEAKVIGAMDVRNNLIKLMENQERLRLKLQGFTKEIERLKKMTNELDRGAIKASSI